MRRCLRWSWMGGCTGHILNGRLPQILSRSFFRGVFPGASILTSAGSHFDCVGTDAACPERSRRVRPAREASVFAQGPRSGIDLVWLRH